jgi:hypothetical protein
MCAGTEQAEPQAGQIVREDLCVLPQREAIPRSLPVAGDDYEGRRRRQGKDRTATASRIRQASPAQRPTPTAVRSWDPVARQSAPAALGVTRRQEHTDFRQNLQNDRAG